MKSDRNGERKNGSKQGDGAVILEHVESHLSAREESVLKLLAWGYTNKEVATKLSLSVKTVETYRLRLVRKLELRGRVDMVAYANEHGGFDERP
jgi:DNA-binding NarL/FixJ family response regulator